jgi:fluoride exporter
MQTLLVFLGGGTGSICRYWVSRWLAGPPGAWPIATLTVNLLGCFVLGLLLTQRDRLGSAGLLLLATGFCGGFTTFSTFALESRELLNGRSPIGVSYPLLSISLGLGAASLGDWVGRWLNGGIKPL